MAVRDTQYPHLAGSVEDEELSRTPEISLSQYLQVGFELGSCDHGIGELTEGLYI